MLFRRNLLLLAITVACIYQTEAISARWTTVDFNCPWEGFFCGSCGTIVYCERNYPMQSYTAYLSTNCTLTGETCTQASGTPACTSDHDISCDPSVAVYQFKCNQPGVFPDPYSCRKYHICSSTTPNSDPATFNCPGGYSFNVATMRCDIKSMYNANCSNVVQPCKGPSNGIRIANNPTLYYTCTLDPSSGFHQPRLYACPKNFIFMGGQCVDPDTYSEGINKNTGICTGNGLFFYPHCEIYYNCTENQYPHVSACEFGYEFDFHLKTCVPKRCKYLRN